MTKVTVLLIFLLFSSCFVFGQPGDPNGGGPPGSVPITGIEILLAAGGVLGIKRIMGFNRKSKNP